MPTGLRKPNPPSRENFSAEKSTVEGDIYGGLQVDQRAQMIREKNIDPCPSPRPLDDVFDKQFSYLNEKQDYHIGVDEMRSPASSFTHPSPMTRRTTDALTWGNPVTPQPSEPLWEPAPEKLEARRTCGVRRRYFWISILVLGLLLVLALAVGLIVGLRNKSQASMVAGPNKANGTSWTPYQSSDVMVGSPLNVISYDKGGSGSPATRQSFRMFYQSLIGNIKLAVSEGGSWQSATPIFTDAINNTGLATVTYMNGTKQQGSIFYVGLNGLLQEKRQRFVETSAWWMPGSLNSMNLPASGNVSTDSGDEDPKNGWDGYRMAAVYSRNFSTGPGIRLFYHSPQLNGSSFVQEMIWIQGNDSWIQGAQILGAHPGSHLTTTVDESIGVLRLFFSANNGTLQEMWTKLSSPPASAYKKGLDIKNFLGFSNTDIAAVSNNGTTLLYHYTTPITTANASNTGIHELTITGNPSDQTNQESFTSAEKGVSKPILSTNGFNSPYQPLTAATTVVPGFAPSVFVFWADKVTGDPVADPMLTGYGELTGFSRPWANATWPAAGEVAVPLGSDNSQPT